MKKKINKKIFALLLALCMVATLLPVTVFAAGKTPITEVTLTNSNIPETITSDMKMTDVMRTVNCSAAGVNVGLVNWWNITKQSTITADTVLCVGDTIEMIIFLKSEIDYEFPENADKSFNGTVTFNGSTPNEVYVNSGNLYVRVQFTVALPNIPSTTTYNTRVRASLVDVVVKDADGNTTTLDKMNPPEGLSETEKAQWQAEQNALAQELANNKSTNGVIYKAEDTKDYFLNTDFEADAVTQEVERQLGLIRTFAEEHRLNTSFDYETEEVIDKRTSSYVIIPGTSEIVQDIQQYQTLKVSVTIEMTTDYYNEANKKISTVELENSNTPAEINSNMKIDEYKQGADCNTEGCNTQTPASEWNDLNGGGLIKADTVLKAGNTICQTITVYADDGYVFDESLNDNTAAVTFNGKPVTNVTLWDMDGDGKNELVVGVEYTVKEAAPVVQIDTIKIKNATLSYQDGDKPKFTAESAEPDLYYVYLETVTDDATGNFLTSSEYFNNEEHRGDRDLIETLDSGKTYAYNIWVKPVMNGDEAAATFINATKIVINGTTYNLSDYGDNQPTENDWAGVRFFAVPDIQVAKSGETTHTHTYDDWKSDSTNHWKECSCGDKIDVAAHDFKWVVDKEATATAAGSKHEECKTCGYKKAAVAIPATTEPSKPSETNPDTEADDTKSPQTGDNSNMALWFALLFGSCGGVIGTTVYSKRKKQQVK